MAIAMKNDTNWETILVDGYKVGVELGILNQITLEEFKSKIDIKEIENEAVNIREKKEAAEKFYRSHGADDEFIASRDEWIENFEIRSVGFRLLDIAQKNKKAIDMDWKADYEEVFGAMKEVIPELAHGDDEASFRERDVVNIVTVFSQRNAQILAGKEFRQYETYGDNIGFLLVDNDRFEKFRDNLFIKFI
jgi:hypothetical protein